MPSVWQVSRSRTLTLDVPRVIAIINATPDSFHAGSRVDGAAAALRAAREAIDAGANMLDLGGESTRPGAARVPAEEQMRRDLPALEAIRGALPEMSISIDTKLSRVAEAALAGGADAINDVSAGLEDPEMLGIVARAGAGLVLMHRGAPPPLDHYSDQYVREPLFVDVVREVGEFLARRARAAVEAGVAPGAIALDPGLGFGKSVEHNLDLIARTRELAALGYPIVSAASRKSFVGRVSLGRDSTPDERLAGSIAASVAHWHAGARLFRVHDPGPQGQALRVAAALTRDERYRVS